MSSVWGRVTSPDVSAYVASKHAARALSECLRTHDARIDGGWRSSRSRELLRALLAAAGGLLRGLAGR